jgi:threonine dehydrogenase-like Zn-dependent dehydrogenase
MSTGLAAVCPRDIRGRGGGRCERAVLHRGGDRPYGVGADAVLECVGTSQSMTQTLRSTRPGGFVGIVGVPHGVELAGEELLYSHVGVRGAPTPIRRFLPELIDLVCNREIEAGKVFDLTLPLGQAAEGYRAMDERRTIKTPLRPETTD